MSGPASRELTILAWLACVAACSGIRDVYVGSDVAAASTSSVPTGAAGATSVDPSTMIQTEPAEPQAGLSSDAGPTVEVEAAPPMIDNCSAVQIDCDGDPNNGCETDSEADRAHCGRCGNACATPDCSCSGGQLVTTCASGRADCDGDARNGCEVDTDTSMQHCGRCQRACHTNGHDAIDAVCVAGHCRITCEAEAFPEGDCDDNPDNGCETQLFMNDQHCGACGVRCTCNMGRCL